MNIVIFKSREEKNMGIQMDENYLMGSALVSGLLDQGLSVATTKVLIKSFMVMKKNKDS